MDKKLGLYVENGTLKKDGKEYTAMGINYFSAFYRRIMQPDVKVDYAKDFAELTDYEIPFIRFMAGGFWPGENKLYFEEKSKYFDMIDELVEGAEKAGLGLIPSLFWFNAAVSDIADEHRNSWGDVASRTHKIMLEYTQDMVKRYKSSKAIWGWEFGNEYNLEADLPEAAKYRPGINKQLGTREIRNTKDDLTIGMVRTAQHVFAKKVREYDNDRIIVSGNGGPRHSAWHLMNKGTSWDDMDNEEQLREVLEKDSFDPIDTVSSHLYFYVYGAKATDEYLKVLNKEMRFEDYVRVINNIAKEMKKPLFVGEFGASEKDGHETAKKLFARMLKTFKETQVPLSAAWVYNFPPQDNEWNITFENNRKYQLDAIKDYNS